MLTNLKSRNENFVVHIKSNLLQNNEKKERVSHVAHINDVIVILFHEKFSNLLQKKKYKFSKPVLNIHECTHIHTHE